MKKASSDEKEDRTKWIRSVMILEIIGRPPEHLIETLEGIIKNIDEEKGVHVTSKKINEPVVMKDNNEFYTTFAEIDLEVEDILYLAILMFKYMPAHIEVLQPDLIALTNGGWTDILSELTRRLHAYDEVSRILQLQNANMQKKMRELMSGNKEAKEEVPVKKDNKEKISKDNKK